MWSRRPEEGQAGYNMGGGGREGELPGGEATLEALERLRVLQGMLSPLWVFCHVLFLGALRGGASVTPNLQRWELRLREVKALPKVTQLLYKLMNIPHPCSVPPQR